MPPMIERHIYPTPGPPPTAAYGSDLDGFSVFHRRLGWYRSRHTSSQRLIRSRPCRPTCGTSERHGLFVSSFCGREQHRMNVEPGERVHSDGG
jgi:hypothetical protein